jgi:hypothetical protein
MPIARTLSSTAQPLLFCNEIPPTEFQSRLLSLAPITPRYKVLLRNATKAFITFCDSLSSQCAFQPSKRALFQILAAPRVCLSAKHDSAIAPAIRLLPRVRWSPHNPDFLPTSLPGQGKVVERLIEQGRYSTTARHLARNPPNIGITHQIADPLAFLHPCGLSNAFSSACISPLYEELSGHEHA